MLSQSTNQALEKSLHCLLWMDYKNTKLKNNKLQCLMNSVPNREPFIRNCYFINRVFPSVSSASIKLQFYTSIHVNFANCMKRISNTVDIILFMC